MHHVDPGTILTLLMLCVADVMELVSSAMINTRKTVRVVGKTAH